MLKIRGQCMCFAIGLAIASWTFAADRPINAPSLPMNAIVIGNQNYGASINSLKNPINDANLMGNVLEQIGFKVVKKMNLSHEEMDEAISEFCRSLEPGSISFFYFAGHGMQDANGKNYLIPTDAKLPSESSIPYQTVALDFVVDSMEKSSSPFRIVVLDCCRDNPFTRGWGRGSSKVGLSPVVAPKGTLIAYSTSKGMTASDGEGRDNSLYTEKLASALVSSAKNGKPVLNALREASQMVGKQSNQVPYLGFDATMPDLFLGPNRASNPGTSTAQQTTLQPNDNISHGAPNSRKENSVAPTDKFSGKFESIETSLRDGNHRSAASGYTEIIADPSVTPEALRRARIGRGSILLTLKSDKNDIINALRDYEAAKERGVRVAVEANSDLVQNSSLDGSAKTNVTNGKIFKGEVVLATKSERDWIWIEEVQGNPSRRGWVDASVFVVKSAPSVVNYPPVVATPVQPITQPTYPPPSPEPQPMHGRGINPNQKTARPPRPLGPWQTPEWESPAEVERIRRAQQKWDRENGGQ